MTSNTYDVYARPRGRAVDFERDVASVVGSSFESLEGQEGLVAEVEGAFVDLFFAHDLTDDRDLPFGSYPLSVNVRGKYGNEVRAKEVAERIYIGLDALGGYDLFLSYDVFDLLRRNTDE